MKNGICIGVGAVVFRGESEVLLIRRGKAPFLGQWSIPGGGLEYGEAIGDAILREVREETAIAARLIGPIGVFEALPRMVPGEGDLPHSLMIDYAAEWISGEPIAGDDAADAAFLPFDEAAARVNWDQTRLALKKAREIREAARLAL